YSPSSSSTSFSNEMPRRMKRAIVYRTNEERERPPVTSRRVITSAGVLSARHVPPRDVRRVLIKIFIYRKVFNIFTGKKDIELNDTVNGSFFLCGNGDDDILLWLKITSQSSVEGNFGRSQTIAILSRRNVKRCITRSSNVKLVALNFVEEQKYKTILPANSEVCYQCHRHHSLCTIRLFYAVTKNLHVLIFRSRHVLQVHGPAFKT
ncbi:hypothetical protein ALC53_05675, partial [Atta colombica]